MHKEIFLAILAAAFINYMFKITPMILSRNIQIKSNNFIKILDYASCCIIGQIIYSAAFKNANFILLWESKNLIHLINFIFILLSFYICLKTNSIMKSIFVSLTLFTFVIFSFT
ncbi:AzlD domain-containing protein [Fluviispira multicolorata]|nr:AzlD domain-containing protein [Fluviispira multicolorata]